MGFSRARARAVSSTVSAADRTIWVARDRRTPAWFRAPTWQDVTTQKPALTPKANCRKMNTSDVVSLTPATSWAVRVWPTMAASLMEYTCCSRYDKITGSEKIRIVFQHVPFVRSMGPNRDFFVFSISKTSDSKEQMIIAPPRPRRQAAEPTRILSFSLKKQTLLWCISTINIRHANIRYVRFILYF